VLIHDEGHRVLLDFGLDIPAAGDLFRAPLSLPPVLQLTTRLRVGAAPTLPGIYDPATLAAGDPLGESAEPVSVFLSHAHIDHVGLTGFIRPDVPIHAAPETIALLAALDGLGSRDVAATALPMTAPVQVGPMRVERFDVDHDVPGASGYRVTTDDGVLVFTGDIRFHGHRPEASWAFVEAVEGCDLLVTEGTTLGWDVVRPQRTEADVARDYEAALADSADLMIQSIYPRDLDRVRAFMGIAASLERTILWPASVAAFLVAAGVPDAASVDACRDAMREAPGRFVVQLDPDDLPALLDLPIGPGSAVLHANGEPLGPFDARWSLYTDWLGELGLPLRRMGCTGHASPDDLHEMLYRIRPKVVVPIHTTAPYRLHPVGGPERLVVEYAQPYAFPRGPLRGLGRFRPRQ
jgi:ribonuclease J